MNCNLLARVLLACVLLPACCLGQDTRPRSEPAPRPVKSKDQLKFKHESFTFVRIRHSDTGGRAAHWATDYPDSDLNLTARVAADTGLKTDPQGKVLRLTDADLKRFPFAYLVEPGSLDLSNAEAAALRAYLLGGGFLMMDDCWGAESLAHVRGQLAKVFPDRPLAELPLDHPLFHCFYELTTKPQVPSIHAFASGTPAEWNRSPANYLGISDEQGRLLVVVCHNTDLGDGWERDGVDERYTREISQRLAFPMGVNIVVHSLTR